MEKIKLVMILAFIAGISGLLLTSVNNITEPIIIEAKAQKELDIITKFYPTVADTKKNEVTDEASNVNYQTEVYDQDNNLLGYVYSVSGANGYGSITSIIAIDKDNKIQGIDFSEFSQTPGFGDKLLSEEYLNQYQNLDANNPVVDGVSGATFSSKLVAAETEEASNYHLGGNHE